MRQRCYKAMIIVFAVILTMLLSSCDLNLTTYSIQIRLGHQNDKDPNSVTFTLSDLPPKTLDYLGWYPDASSYFEHTVKLEKASDFSIVVEASDGTLYHQSITIKDGYRYSIYYQDASAWNNIFSIESAP